MASSFLPDSEIKTVEGNKSCTLAEGNENAWHSLPALSMTSERGPSISLDSGSPVTVYGETRISALHSSTATLHN